MITARARILALPALMALAQLTAPGPAHAGYMLVAICGPVAGRAAPIRVPIGNRDSSPAPCCKICHSAMRKRSAGTSCCAGEDESNGT